MGTGMGYPGKPQGSPWHSLFGVCLWGSAWSFSIQMRKICPFWHNLCVWYYPILSWTLKHTIFGVFQYLVTLSQYSSCTFLLLNAFQLHKGCPIVHSIKMEFSWRDWGNWTATEVPGTHLSTLIFNLYLGFITGTSFLWLLKVLNFTCTKNYSNWHDLHK